MNSTILKHKATLIQRVREFFQAREVLEIHTPCITPYPVSDPHIESIALATTQPAFLRTSPESALKWLLAHKLGDIYELGPVFRAGELGDHHQPEFLMLEWYRLNFDWRMLADEVIELIHVLCDGFQPTWPTRFYSWEETLEMHLGLTLENTERSDLIPCLHTPLANDSRVLDWTREELLDYLYATQVQTRFSKECITVVYDYPHDQCALAQLNADGRTARRFEVFIGAIEVGNGYEELTDREEQAHRFLADQEKRQMMGRPIATVDHRLLQALEMGLPPCSGVALGLERIIMAILGAHRLSDVMALHSTDALANTPSISTGCSGETP
jgi:lysyl-tRNA synthetase class 2